MGDFFIVPGGRLKKFPVDFLFFVGALLRSGSKTLGSAMLKKFFLTLVGGLLLVAAGNLLVYLVLGRPASIKFNSVCIPVYVFSMYSLWRSEKFRQRRQALEKELADLELQLASHEPSTVDEGTVISRKEQ